MFTAELAKAMEYALRALDARYSRYFIKCSKQSFTLSTILLYPIGYSDYYVHWIGIAPFVCDCLSA